MGRAPAPTPTPEAFARQVTTLLGPDGQARLRSSRWWVVLETAGPAVLAGYSAQEVAAEIGQGPRCGVCGHPLRRTAEPVLLRADGRDRTVRGLPHLAPCSCGYTDRIIEDRWRGPLQGHFTARPEATTLDASDPAFLAALPSPG